MSLPPSLKARILADAPKVPPRRAPPVVLVGVVASGWAVVFALVHGRRSNWTTLTESATWVTLGELAVLAALVSLAVLARGKTMLGPAARWLLLALAVPVLAFAGVALTTAPAATPTPNGAFVAATVGCDALSLVAALPLLGLLLWQQRDRILSSPGRVGAVAGVAAAAWGHALLHWTCPWTDLGHVFLGHVLPAVPLAITGAILMGWLQRRSVSASLSASSPKNTTPR